MEQKFVFTKEQLTAIMQELGKMPFHQVHNLIAYIDKIAMQQIKTEDKK